MAASSVDLPTSFQRHPPAENKSVRTAETYLKAVQQLDAFLRTRGIDLAAADRDDEELLRRLLATCAGRDFEARRDRALILLLLDTGWAMWTSSTTWCWWSARAAASGPCRSATGPARRSTSTYAPVPATPTPTWSGSGSGCKGRVTASGIG
jgi:hypothetical protein